jgi:hypothetical protein
MTRLKEAATVLGMEIVCGAVVALVVLVAAAIGLETIAFAYQGF